MPLTSGCGFLLAVLPIVPALTRCCFSGADQPGSSAAIREADDQETLPDRVTDDQLPSLLSGMIEIVENVREWIGESLPRSILSAEFERANY